MVSAAKKHRKQCVAKLLSKRLLEDHVAALRACVKEHKNKRAPARTPDGRLRVFSDCAGISSELIALKLLGFSSENLLWVGGSETDAVKRVLMQCVHRCCDMPTKKECVEKDMFKRNLNETSACDLYIAGYPCPAYSRLGKKNGAQDAHGRGLLVFEGLKYIAKWKPSIVVFENVVGFLNKKHEYTHKVMRKCFQALKYKVYMQVLNTKDHGVPQSRPRCYFVAFRTSKKVSFRFPKALKCSKLVHFLDKAEGDDKVDLTTYEEKYGEQIWQEDLVLDIGSSAGWQSKMVVCPCLTRGRCLQKGYYLPKQLRRLSGAECARLQGVPKCIYEKMSLHLQRKMPAYAAEEAAEKQVMGALGDSMSINVLMRLLPPALDAVSLWPKSLPKVDPWSEVSLGKPAAKLADSLFE